MLVMRNFISLPVKDIQKKVKGVWAHCKFNEQRSSLSIFEFSAPQFSVQVLEFIASEAENCFKIPLRIHEKWKSILNMTNMIVTRFNLSPDLFIFHVNFPSFPQDLDFSQIVFTIFYCFHQWENKTDARTAVKFLFTLKPYH